MWFDPEAVFVFVVLLAGLFSICLVVIEGKKLQRAEKELGLVKAELYSCKKDLSTAKANAEKAERERRTLSQNLADKTRELSELDEKHRKRREADLQNAIASREFKINSLTKALSESREYVSKLERFAANIDRRFKELSRESSGLRGEIAILEETLVAEKKESESLGKSLKSARSQLLAEKKQAQSLLSSIKELEGSLKSTKAQVKKLEAGNVQARAQLDEKCAELATLSESLARKSEEAKTLSARYGDSLKIQESLLEEVSRQKETIARLEQDIKQKPKEIELQISSLKKKVLDLEKALGTEGLQLAKLQRKKLSLEEELELAKGRIFDLERGMEDQSSRFKKEESWLKKTLREQRARLAVLEDSLLLAGQENESLRSALKSRDTELELVHGGLAKELILMDGYRKR